MEELQKRIVEITKKFKHIQETNEKLRQELGQILAENERLRRELTSRRKKKTGPTIYNEISDNFSLWFHNIGFQEIKGVAKIYDERNGSEGYVDKYIKFYTSKFKYVCLNEFPNPNDHVTGHYQASIFSKNPTNIVEQHNRRGKRYNLIKSRLTIPGWGSNAPSFNLICLHGFVFSYSTNITQIFRAYKLLKVVLDGGPKNNRDDAIIVGDFNLPIDDLVACRTIIEKCFNNIPYIPRTNNNQPSLDDFVTILGDIKNKYTIMSVGDGQTTNYWDLIQNDHSDVLTIEKETKVDYILISRTITDAIDRGGYKFTLETHELRMDKRINKRKFPPLPKYSPFEGKFLKVHDHVGFSLQLVKKKSRGSSRRPSRKSPLRSSRRSSRKSPVKSSAYTHSNKTRRLPHDDLLERIRYIMRTSITKDLVHFNEYYKYPDTGIPFTETELIKIHDRAIDNKFIDRNKYQYITEYPDDIPDELWNIDRWVNSRNSCLLTVGVAIIAANKILREQANKSPLSYSDPFRFLEVYTGNYDTFDKVRGGTIASLTGPHNPKGLFRYLVRDSIQKGRYPNFKCGFRGNPTLPELIVRIIKEESVPEIFIRDNQQVNIDTCKETVTFKHFQDSTIENKYSIIGIICRCHDEHWDGYVPVGHEYMKVDDLHRRMKNLAKEGEEDRLVYGHKWFSSLDDVKTQAVEDESQEIYFVYQKITI